MNNKKILKKKNDKSDLFLKIENKKEWMCNIILIVFIIVEY